MSQYKKLLKALKKAAGEGSKGGHIIGHTKSGKPIYANSSHSGHAGFNSNEHREAANAHHEIWSKTQDRIAGMKSKNRHWNPPQPVHHFLTHHFTNMRAHQNQANTKMDHEARAKEGHREGFSEIKGNFPYHTIRNIHKSHEDEVPFHAATVIINPEKTKFLMGKRYKDDIWTSPAGGAHLGEMPKDTAIREAFEEANILLEESQLQELPMLYTKHFSPVHCFVAILNEGQMKNITTVNDPDEEIKKWKWFNLHGEMPEPIDTKRFNTILNAKIKLAEEVQKSMFPLDDMEGMTTISTADFAQESESEPKEKKMIEELMSGFQSGDAPVCIPLSDSQLFLTKVDEGMYSGFVKRKDRDGLLETVVNIDKMTIPSLIQFLIAKEVIKNQESPEPVSIESKLKSLIQESMEKEAKMIYVSMDGDNIGNKVAQAEARDDEKSLMDFSRKINEGQSLFEMWATSMGGTIIEGGGDEALAKVPESSKEKIEIFRDQYKKVVGATVTIGVGELISQATKARQLGKLKGKDRIETFSASTDKDLAELMKPKDAVEKLKDSQILDLDKALRKAYKGATNLLFRDSGTQITSQSKDDDSPAHHIPANTAAQSGDSQLNHLDVGNEKSKIPTGKDRIKPSIEAQNEVGETDDLEPREGMSKSLLEKLEKALDGSSASHGTVRNYQGLKFIKESSGHWMPMTSGDSDQETHLKEKQDPPSSVAQSKEEHEGATSEIPMSMADQEGHALSPKPGPGGHVPIHSKDVKKVLTKGPYSIVSGHRNTHDAKDRALTDDQVKTRHKQMEDDLIASGHKYTKIKEQNGEKRDAFMVHHADPKHMEALAKKHNQYAVIHSKENKNKYSYTNGVHDGKWHQGNGYQEVPDAADYFTSLDTSDGKNKKISHNIDYEKMYPDEDGTVN